MAEKEINMDIMGTSRRERYCGEFRVSDVGCETTVAGFINKRRDLGNLIFLDLRDRSGILQLVISDEISGAEILEKASGARAEFVVMATGKLRERESKNPEIPTGEVELCVTEFKILSQAEVPPFEINDNISVNEELRLKYRYLDLRRPSMTQTLVNRHRIVKIARDYFDRNGFIEIETPILIKSTPEGARDYLVPSRVHKGEFYALPQSPQLYKQLCMLSGLDRYMQIAKCFRDEDLRADRQPEFTQIDLEMSFADVDDVIGINEGFVSYLCKEFLGKEVALPLPRLSYDEAMEQYGCDKPDLRFDLKLINLTDAVANSEFVVFKGAIEGGGSVRALNLKGGASKLSRKEIDKLVDVVKTYKAKGLAFTRYTAEARSSSFEKFLSEGEIAAIGQKADFCEGDLLMIVADADNNVVFDALSALRLHLGDKLDLYDKNELNFLWVVDFPLFEYSAEDDRYYAKHHPFTAPRDSDIDKLTDDKANCYAKAYDLVMNGTEVGGGSVRINNPELQSQMFDALGFTKEEAAEQFGFLMEAFSFGAPPHAGMAYGLDRLCMLLLGKDNIKEVMAFPKVQNARELMVMSPSAVDKKQLDELGLLVSK